MKIKIIGCGITGIISAVILKEMGHNVEIFDSRDHIGGNCFDEKIENITVHKYGAHIFHTNDENVWSFVNRYTKFNNYTHKVRANTNYGLISLPYSFLTRDQIGRDLSLNEIQKLIFVDYSERHWGVAWDSLPPSIINRVPTKRESYDDRYFTDKYQGMPISGYSNMFKSMLDGIEVHLSVDNNYYKKIINDSNFNLLIYTGKIDDYFDYCYGELEYRSLKFEHVVTTKTDLFNWEKGAVINECNKKPFNRTVDNSVFLNENFSNTVLTRDFPEDHNKHNDPIYPKNFGKNIEVYSKYNKLANKQNKVMFLGRLATYKYLDMWMAIKQVFNKLNYSL
jgi:UDP-galactopyranose mutase